MIVTKPDTFLPLSRRRLLQGALAAAPLLAMPAALFSSIARAAAALTEQDRADVARVEKYMDSVMTLEAKFQQVDANGKLSFGRIYVRKPGRLRVEYDPPVPILVVADGGMISYYDSELDQLNQLPLQQSTAWFLVRHPIDLEDGVTISGIDRRPGALQLKLFQTSEPNSGSVELIFADNPLELRQWRVVDAQNKEVRVGLYEVHIGGDLPASLFATPRTQRRSGGNKG
jgi:outer membrane lipoprotein-sorting protein